MTSQDRRQFIRTSAVAASAVTAACLGACNAPGANPSTKKTTGAPSEPSTIAARDVPMGGAALTADQHFLVTQPTQGKFEAFSSVCPHQQATVMASGQKFVCPRHGSEFAIGDGAVLRGPANKPLTPAKATLEGDTVKITA